jgi:hypothetical protein
LFQVDVTTAHCPCHAFAQPAAASGLLIGKAGFDAGSDSCNRASSALRLR